nr:PREDICTED: serine/arginine repetitive matrix protein 3-like [Rhinolophus sinicus]XP_019602848.1 PREDICTED: serine/arginine repetitive matrix protein 3-like [Rhinolophus sinicus]
MAFAGRHSSAATPGRTWFLESAGQRSPSSRSLRNRHHSRTTAQCSAAAVQGPRGGAGRRGAASGHSRAWGRAGLRHDDSHDEIGGPLPAASGRCRRAGRRATHFARGAQGAGPGAATPRAAPELWRHGRDAGSGAGARRCRATGRTWAKVGAGRSQTPGPERPRARPSGAAGRAPVGASAPDPDSRLPSGPSRQGTYGR